MHNIVTMINNTVLWTSKLLRDRILTAVNTEQKQELCDLIKGSAKTTVATRQTNTLYMQT